MPPGLNRESLASACSQSFRILRARDGGMISLGSRAAFSDMHLCRSFYKRGYFSRSPRLKSACLVDRLI